ncbi:hypothetical protein OGAPHI_002865 [Ogataea philodendri]|uniref:Uncharacterized protein n=1 Tax=Ogataea philodendri TaxID=1378263 RepID=A0A9P8T5X5_9ASCO|nr:uncharacterized protein OGAPHI_002865 [Ogataea philodendri]KAH3667216.1 hypothetical protein OGAPHI_002865 [Ogataea philodendri]
MDHLYLCNTLLSVLVIAFSLKITAIIVGFNFDLEVCGIVVVWIWNQGQVCGSRSVTGTKIQWSPVSNSTSRSSPHTAIFIGNTCIVNVVLSRCLLTLPLVVRIFVNNRQDTLATSLHNSWNDHILGSRVIGSANSDGLVKLRHHSSGVFTPFAKSEQEIVPSSKDSVGSEKAERSPSIPPEEEVLELWEDDEDDVLLVSLWELELELELDVEEALVVEDDEDVASTVLLSRDASTVGDTVFPPASTVTVTYT